MGNYGGMALEGFIHELDFIRAVFGEVATVVCQIAGGQEFDGLVGPGVAYGAGTTSAYALQCLPMQHGLFSQLPPDVIIVPLAFRGIHALWPKCPAGNLHIDPGKVEVIVCPPMLGETTLLPRKRALRTQLEPATLFQAVHIANLFNPEPSPPTEERS